MKKLLFTNVAYGPTYAEIFLNYHLKSFLDKSNIPAFKDRCEYVIFTDKETAPSIQAHPLFHTLEANIPVHLVGIDWPKEIQGNAAKFNKRYGVLISTFRQGVQMALEKDMLCSPMVADLVVAEDYVPKLFSRFEAGHDSVFVLPMRTAYEAMVPGLRLSLGALKSEQLFALGYAALHPLWVACHWNSPQFTRLPFTLLWNNPGTGLLARSFSITPIAFQPTKEMAEAKQVIDVEIPALCTNPYWATDWVECPVIGMEPLHCYYPPFKNSPATEKDIAEWGVKSLHPSQFKWLEKSLYYPKLNGQWPHEQQASDFVVANILAARSQLANDNVKAVGS